MSIQIGPFGYTPDPRATEEFAKQLPPLYREQLDDLRAFDDDGDRLNYRHLVRSFQAAGQSEWIRERDGIACLKSRSQGSVGSCVGFGTATSCDVVAACDIHARHELEQWFEAFSADALYVASREIAGLLGPSDGSYGSAAAKAIREWGTIHETIYGRHDLREYSADRAKSWGRTGLPSDLKKAILGQHPIEHTVQLKNAQDAWSLIGFYYAFNMCSEVGWARSRNSEGAIRRRGEWSHSMSVTSRRTTKSGDRLFLVHQSWGDDWTDGPYWEDQPWGSFWAYWDDIDKAIKQWNDCFGYSGYAGFVVKNLPDIGVHVLG